MASGRKVYPPEFKRRMVELVRAGRSPESLAKEFDPSANTIRKWAVQADLDEGLRADGTVGSGRKADVRGKRLRRSVDGVDAAVGPHPDGTWVAGWYVEPQARCDLYTMVFYPTWNPGDVEAVLDSMIRVAG